MTVDLMAAALRVAEAALAAGELPIGAVVAVGDEIVARAHTGDVGAARRLAHAEMLALDEADRLLGWRPRAATSAGSGFRPFATVMAGLPDVA